MSQHRLRVSEPEGLSHKRTTSEDNLYLAVLRASEGKKGSGHSLLGRSDVEPGVPASCRRKPGPRAWGGGGQTLMV